MCVIIIIWDILSALHIAYVRTFIPTNKLMCVQFISKARLLAVAVGVGIYIVDVPRRRSRRRRHRHKTQHSYGACKPTRVFSTNLL